MLSYFFLALAGMLLWTPSSYGQDALFALEVTRVRSRVLRLDPQSGAVLGSFETPVLCRFEGACGLAFGGRSLYFADATDPERAIYEINPENGAIWHSLPMPAPGVDGLAFAGDTLYVSSFRQDRIFALDPFDGRVLNTLEPGVDLVGGLGALGNRVFASGIRPGTLYEFDARSGAPIRQFAAPGDMPVGLEVLGNRLLVADIGSEEVVAVDIGSGRALGTLFKGRVAALAGGRVREGLVPYALRLRLEEELLRSDGRVELVLRAGLYDERGRLLKSNNQSRILFDISGAEGLLGEEPSRRVQGGEVVLSLVVDPGQFLQVEAQLAGLETASLRAGAVAPAAAVEVSLVRGEGRQVEVSATLLDAFGELAGEDTSSVNFRVVSGGGVVVGSSRVKPQGGIARTQVEVARRQATLVVEARVRQAQGQGRLEVGVDEVAEPVSTGGLVVSASSAAGRDERPPAPAEEVRVHTLGQGRVEVRWVLSADEGPDRWFTFGERMVRQRSVWGYRIYRSRDGGFFSEVGQVAPGVNFFVDAPGETGSTYRYKVLVEDRDNLHEVSIAPGSAADRQRTLALPRVGRDARGRLVHGLFDNDDDVDLDDFFLFVDHFGRRSGQLRFDGRFDLNGSGVVDFEDFFLFGDSFGRVALKL